MSHSRVQCQYERQARVHEFNQVSSTLLTSFRPSRSTVADLIQKLENPQRFDDSTPSRSRSPQIDIPSEGLRSQAGRGRRQEGSFGPPAERASRDGIDGARRDGRPPVGPSDSQLSPPTLPSPSLSPRAATSLATKSLSRDDPFLGRSGSMKAAGLLGSTETVRESTTEAATARSRLKSIAQKKRKEPECSPPGAFGMDELSDLVDDAIKRQVSDNPERSSIEADLQDSPQPTIVRRWKSARSPRQSIEDVAFHPPSGSPNRSTAQSRQQSSHGRPDILARNPGQDWLPPGPSHSRPTHDPSLRSASPVKQRAAIFERTARQPEDAAQACEAPHDAHIHVKNEWSVVPLHEHTAEKEKDLHHWKFGQTIYDRSGPSNMAVASTHPVKERQNSTQSSYDTQNTFNTANQSPQKADVSDEEPQISGGLSRPQARKAPMNWLHNWRVFSKGSSVLPQTDNDVVEASPHRDEHYPSTRPSIVKGNIQEYLRREEEERSRRQSEMERKSRNQSEVERKARTQSRRPSPVKDNKLVREAVPGASALKPAQLPPLQVPAQEEAELIATPLEIAERIPSEATSRDSLLDRHSMEPKAPIHRSWAEKEVLNATEPQSQPRSARSGSPIKPAPSTPVRGRPSKVRQSVSPRGSPYTNEQTFVLSPVPSTSRSRASSRVRVHKVCVEMRDSPDRAARERGETVLTVRATGMVEEDGEAEDC